MTPEIQSGHVTGRTLSTRRKLLFSLVAICLFFLSTEVICRFYESLKSPPKDLAFMSSPVSIMQEHPYYAYEPSPNHPQHNRQGFRGAEDHREDFQGVRVVCLGGSKTYGTRVDEVDCYPRVLERLLRAQKHETSIDVVNAGTAGHASHNLLGVMAFKVTPLTPQFVIIDVGHNDIWNITYFKDAKPDNSHAQKVWEYSGHTVPWWRHSAFLNKLAWHLGHPPEPPPHIHRVCWRAPSGEPRQNLEEAGLQTLRSNLVSLLAIIRAHHGVPLVCLQPSDFHNKGGDPVLGSGLERASNAISQIAQSHNVDVLDLRPEMSDREMWFADYLHLNKAGEQKRAELILEWMESLPSWKSAVLRE